MSSTTRTRDELMNELKALRKRVAYFEQVETERNGARWALSEEEERLYRAVVGDFPGLLCRFLPNGQISFVNDACCAYFGKARDELVGKDFFSLVPEEDRSRVRNEILSLSANLPTLTLEHRVIAADGEVRWQRWSNRALFDGAGRVTMFQALGQDITDREQAEECAQRCEARLRAVVEGLPFDFFVIDESGRYAMQNAVCKQRWGDVVGKRPQDVCSDEHTLALWEGNNRRAFAGEVVSGDVAFQVNGIEQHYHNIISPIRYGDQIRGILGVNIDITERKQAEQELREQQGLLASIIEGTDDRIFGKDLDGRYVLVNSAEADGFGKPADQLLGLTDKELLDPEQAKEVIEIDRQVLASGKNLTYEQHMEVPGRGPRTYSVRKYPRFNRDGRVIGVLGIARDITERKEAEDALRESEAKYRTLFESAADAIFLARAAEANLVFVDCNPRALRMFGCTHRDMIGKTPLDLSPPVQPDGQPSCEGAIRRMRRVLAGEPQFFEWQHCRLDGGVFDTEVTLNRISLPGGPFVLGIVRDVTERKRVEEALKASEARYQDLYNNAPDMFFSIEAETARISGCNEQAAQTLGHRKEDLIGRPVFDLYDPECIPRAREAFREFVRTGKVQNTELRAKRKDGSTLDVMLNASAIRDEHGKILFSRSILRDITDRKRAEEELHLAQFTVDRAAIATFWLSPEARVLRVNRAACESLGYSRDELLSMTIHDFDPDFPAETWPTLWAGLKRQGSSTFESRHRRKNGEVFPVEITSNYLEFQGREYKVAFARDITERKRADEERRHLEAQIQHAQKLESLGVLAGGIAHDFNNILMGVLGNAQLGLQILPPDSPVCEFLREIDAAANRAADLTKQMLAYSGRGKFVTEPVDLSELVTEMAHLLRVSISKKANLHYDFSPGLPAVDADATQLRQVIMNLVINASEAIGDIPGKITVSTGVCGVDDARSAEMHLSEGSALGTCVYLKVTDDGCGMDDQTRAKLFDPFFTTKFTGRGLGLAAVQGIVRGHRGVIQVESEPGCGTTFQVLFPACDQPVTPVRKQEHSPRTPGRTGTVLVVDDEDLSLSVAQKALERAGFCVLTVRDGREALEVFRTRKEEINVVLLDLTMPHLSGAEVFEEIRRMRTDARVIVTSGYNEKEATSRFSGTAFAGFIQKPYTPQALVAKVSEVISS